MKSALPRIAGLTILVGALLTLTTAAASAQVVTDPVTGHSFGIVPSAGANRSLSNSTAPLRAASRRLPFTATCNADGHDCTPLAYNGGPVQHQQQLYLFFWDPSGTLPAAYKNGLNTWVNEIAAASGTNGNPLSVNQQYYDCPTIACTSKTAVAYDVHNAGSIVDTTAYPTSANCPAATGYSVCLTDAQIEHELSSYIALHGLPKGLGVQYFVFTPQGVNSCFDTSSDSCASNAFCGYHSNFSSGGTQVLYADMPWLSGISGCDIQGSEGWGYPSIPSVDPVVSVFSHELSETMTDPEPPSGWVQPDHTPALADDGYEIGDKCSYIYGSGGYASILGLPFLSGPAYYNVQLGSDRYLLQLEFDNQLQTCESGLQQPVGSGTPTVSGSPQQGQVLSESHATWNPTATSYSYQWQDCDSAGGNCFNITGAASQTYVLAAADVGHAVRVVETGGNDFGAGVPLASAVTTVVVPPPPTSSTVPAIAGSARQSQTLTESHAGWANSPTAYTYQWQDCDSSGANCSPIGGATGQTYALAASDVGHTIRVQEVAGNAGGSGIAVTSQASRTVLPLAPSAVTAPAITRSATESQTLTEVHGAWANSPTSYSYQWQDCGVSGGSCSPIAGATRQSYTLTASDIGHTIRVQEVATNAGGSGTVTSSAPTSVVRPSAARVTRSLAALLVASGADTKISHLLATGGPKLSFSAPSDGVLQLSWRTGRTAVATARITAGRAGNQKVILKLTSAGRQRLRGASKLQVLASASFTPTAQRPVTLTRTVKLSR